VLSVTQAWCAVNALTATPDYLIIIIITPDKVGTLFQQTLILGARALVFRFLVAFVIYISIKFDCKRVVIKQIIDAAHALKLMKQFDSPSMIV